MESSLHSNQSDYQYTIIKAKEDQSSPSNPSNVLIIRQQSPSQDEDYEEEKSTDKIRKNDRKKSYGSDYVELPKIHFVQFKNQEKERKNSEVNINLPDIDEEKVKISPRLPSSDNESDYLSSVDEENQGYKQGDINNINIVSSKNNYLASEFELVPETPNEKKKRERKNSREIERQLERRQRQRNFQMVSNFLSGKASVIWLFLLGKDTPQEEVDKVRHIYRQHQEDDYEIPLCRTYEQALKFFKLQNCFFKVVVDLENSPKFLEDSEPNKNVVSVYIYNPLQLEGINRAFDLKKNLKKVRGMYNSLEEVTKQAELELENEARFVKVGEDIERQKNKLKFPSFITLSGADSTEVTNYRLCLFGALKLSESAQREVYLKQFSEMVELRYKDVQKQLQNLKEYLRIDHLSDNSPQKMTEILKFYVKQTFYYVLTNSILRLSRTAEQFRPCTIPFNETYHAIKHYYHRYREEVRSGQKKMIVYRGTKLRNSDIKTLAVGSYIELLGFTSTSLKKKEAEKFMDGDSFLFEIHIDKGAENQHQLSYDHGFVQINRYNLASKAFQKEEEVLINALNVFKVTAIDMSSAIRKITLEYGAILPLLRTKVKKLSSADRAVVQNYRYCLDTFKGIEDDGDVLLIAQEHDRCVQYYQAKVNRGEEDFKVYGKLAHAQLQSGDLEEAYTNALKSLQLLQDKSRDDEDIKKTVVQLKKNVEVFFIRQDYLHYHNSIDICLKMLKDDWLEGVRLLKQKADKKLRAGDLAGCEEDLKMAKAVLEDKTQSFDLRRKQIQKRYYIRSLCCACTQSASSQLQEQKQLEMLKIEEEELEFERRKEQIHEVFIQIQNVAKELAEERHDQEEYKKCVESSQKHFGEMEKECLNPITQAKYQVLEASVIDIHQHLPQFQQKMEEAIEVVKKVSPMHQAVGIYSNILGTERQAALKRKILLTPIVPRAVSSGSSNNMPLDGPIQYVPIGEDGQKYNYQQHNIRVIKCKENLKVAAENIAYNAGKQNPEYLSVRNKLIELDFDSSKLLESQRIANETKNFKMVRLHSEGARCYLLLTKIALAKGQLKVAFENVDQALQILRNTLVKIDNKEYNSILLNNPLYIDINLHRAKIYNRQLKHDLALKELKILRKVAEIKRDKHHSSSVLASVFEEEAQIELCNGETDEFENKILDAIQIRQTEMGQYNILNAIAYSNLFKFMMNLDDMETAMEYHFKATEIFSRFPSDHPNFWVIHLSNALIYFKNEETQKCLEQFQNCLRVTNYRYSEDHIITLKVHFQYGQMLKKLQKIPLAMKLFKQCEDVIVGSLKEKIGRGQKLLKQTDDQKFPLLKTIYKEMKSLHQTYSQQRERDLSSVLQAEKYNKHLLEMEEMLVSSSAAELVSK